MTTLLEDEQRRGDGRDRGAIMVTYAAPPEDSVKKYIEDNLELTGIKERNVDCPVIIGHPLFQEGISEQGADGLLPKIGIEWVRDVRTEFIGLSEEHFKNTEEFRNYLDELSQKPDSKRMPSVNTIDQIYKSKFLQVFKWKVESEVVISGFASGNAGRKVSHWLYESVDMLMTLLANDFPYLYQGATAILSDSSEPNISSNDFGLPVFGFEVKVYISQIRQTYRTKPDYLFKSPKKIDFHAENSRSEINFNSFDQGNFNTR